MNRSPIRVHTWLLVNKAYDARKARALKSFIRYGLTGGQEMSEQLSYVRLPQEVAARVLEATETIQRTPTD